MKILKYSIFILLLISTYGCIINQNHHLSPLEQFQLVQQSQQNILTCFQKSLRQGWTLMATYITQQYQKKFKDDLLKILQIQSKRLDQLSKLIIIAESQCEPVLKWAQNQTHVLIQFKLSHRWDSPPCLNTIGEKEQLSNNTLMYLNECVVSQQKINFNLNLRLHQKVKDIYEVKKDGVGTYFVVMEKREPKTWGYLDDKKSKYQIWSQMAQRYENVTKQYYLMMEKIQEKEERKAKSPKSQI